MSNQDSTQNIPALRLDGFEGVWEESSVGEEAPVTMGQSPAGDTYRTTPSEMILVQGNADLENGWVKPRVWTTQPVRTAKAGTLIMSVRAPVGAIGKTQYPVALGRGVAGIEGNDFIFHYLGFLNQSEFWNRVSSGSTFESVNGSTIRNTPITHPPTLEEQQAIGAVFTHLDAAIDQHTNKHRVLQHTKTALMQKMFPQDGQTEPELRLDGFEGEWGVFPLFDVVKRIIDFRGRTPKKLGMDWSKSGHLALSANNVKQGFIDFSQDPHYGDDELYSTWMSGHELHEGQVLFTTEAPLGNVALVPDSRKYILSQRVIAFVLELGLVTDSFFAVTLTSPGVLTQITELSSGGTAKGISQRSLENIHIVIPRQLEEQQAIGAVFTKLDTLISAEAQFIEKLKQTKTALLQKMFV